MTAFCLHSFSRKVTRTYPAAPTPCKELRNAKQTVRQLANESARQTGSQWHRLTDSRTNRYIWSSRKYFGPTSLLARIAGVQSNKLMFDEVVHFGPPGKNFPPFYLSLNTLCCSSHLLYFSSSILSFTSLVCLLFLGHFWTVFQL